MLAEGPADVLQGLAELGLHGVLGDPERLGRLANGQIGVVMQDDGGAHAGRELVNAGKQREALVLVGRRPGPVRNHVELDDAGRGSPHTECPVGGDPQQPRPKALGVPELVAAIERGEQGVHQHVLRCRTIPEDQIGHALDLAPVPLEEVVEDLGTVPTQGFHGHLGQFRSGMRHWATASQGRCTGMAIRVTRAGARTGRDPDGRRQAPPPPALLAGITVWSHSVQVVDAVIGRPSELAALDALLDGLETGVAAVRIEGEPGIGKSTLWREAIRRATDRGIGVLTAAPAETESAYAFAGLADLLRDVDQVVGHIPPPQRLAVDAALLRAEVPPGGIDERTIGAGLLSVLRLLAEDRRWLIAIDDIQWLDLPSQRVLAFATRRLRNERIGYLVTARYGLRSDRVLDRALPVDRVSTIELGPLSVAALHSLFRQQLGHSFPRPVLGRIARTCAGNAMYALEVARELDRSPETGPALPVPAAFGALVEARVGRLPIATRRALLAAASLASPTVERIGGGSLAPAVRAGIVSVDDGVVRFTHPLYASAVYRSAGEAARREMHLELAHGALDREERARHLALSRVAPDAEVAALLGEAADLALARGAPSRSVELLEEAIRLTPADDEEALLRARVTLTRRLLDAGEGARAEPILRDILDRAAPGPLRREAMVQLGWWLTEQGDWAPGVALMEEALEGETDPRAAGLIEVMLTEPYRLDLPRARSHASRALALLDPDTDPAAYAKALQLAVEAQLLAGDGADHEVMARSLALQAPARGSWELSQFAAGWARGMDDMDTARERFTGLADVCRELGLDGELPDALGHLATVELWSGHWQDAEVLAREACELADETGYPVSASLARYALGLVLAQRGEVDEARALAGTTLALFADRPAPILEAQARVVLGQVDLSLEDPAAAVVQLKRAEDLLASIGWREIFHFRFHGDLAEALLQSGRPGDARAVVDRLEASAARIPRPWIEAVAARCRAMVRAAAGDETGAASGFVASLRAHEAGAGPFERGRTLLAQGRFLRRTRQKRLAREALAEAVGIFEEQGARRWVAQANAELRRVTARTAPTDLTTTERLIAGLAAAGLTNGAIARQAFVSPKTVEANLARAYRKLGIRRRAELARALDARGDATIS